MSWLLRRHWHRLTAVVVPTGALLWALALPPTAGAAETKHGDPNFTLASSETVHMDLIVFAEHTEINGEVDGDLIVWSQVVTVNGHVKGDIVCGAQSLRINGTVDGNVRSFAQYVDISGTVARNLMTWSSETNVEDKGSIGGSITFGWNNASLAGNVGGDVLGMTNSLDITGRVGHDLRIRADQLTIGPTAVIKGHVRYESRHEPDIAQGAKVGSIEKVVPHARPQSERMRFCHRVLLWGVGFVFGLVLLVLVPAFYFDATAACQNYAPAAGFGLLFLFATPFAAMIACITIVGLGVGIAILLLYAIAVYASTVFVAGFLGEALLGPKSGTGAAIGRLGLGLFILHVLRVLPYVGGWILFVVIFWGLGAMAMTIYKRLPPPMATAVA